MPQNIGNTMPKEYIVTIQVSFTKQYYVTAVDWEQAEDYALNEAHSDIYQISDYPDIEVVDVDTA
jgi:hypothetical protein